MTFWQFMGETAVQNWITLTSMITTVIISICFFCKTNSINTKKDLDSALFALQKLSFENPYLEDIQFTTKWNLLKKSYNNKKIGAADKDKCLRYEAYCEMLFNYVEQSYNFYKSGKRMEQNVGFKDWVRFHKLWWYNPLEEHRNQDTYSKEVREILEEWLR